MTKLWDAAVAVLRGNDLGGSTKPSQHLYPHQWSWDSAFVAIGYRHLDQRRAEEELRSLFRAQWANGMLPHIVFNPAAYAYMPGPELWQCERSVHAPATAKTSGLCQPPVHATAVWLLYEKGRDRAVPFLREMYPRLLAWHRYLHTCRDPQQEGLALIRHPWESGLDNSPPWDGPLSRIRLEAAKVPTYSRTDIKVVADDDRPSSYEYDRYIYLVGLMREANYDDDVLNRDHPFQVQDVLFNAILCQADQDLARIAAVLGEDPSQPQAWAAQTVRAINEKLWDENRGMYLDFDLRAGHLEPVVIAMTFAPLYAGVASPQQAARLYALLNSDEFHRLGEAGYPVPSASRRGPTFSSRRYWRGPVWYNMNWLLYHGLLRYGYREYAAALRQAMIDLATVSGIFEYYDPFTGKGYGAPNFSWTASLLLDMLIEAGGARMGAETSSVTHDP